MAGKSNRNKNRKSNQQSATVTEQGTGMVIRNTGSSFGVLTPEGRLIDCRIKGNFRLKGIRTTNPVAVGDRVSIAINADGTAYITDIEPRTNYIIRRASNLSKEASILAANVDQACLIVTLSHPVTSTTFIDRFLATAEAYRVPAVIVINKVDLLDAETGNFAPGGDKTGCGDDCCGEECRKAGGDASEEAGEEVLRIASLQTRASDEALKADEEDQTEMPEHELLDAVTYLYRSIGYTVLHVSARTGEGVDELRQLLEGKITLVSGNSGVGKSTLINRIIPGLDLKTAEISHVHDTGMHTTTFSEMFPLPDESGWIIDTPGVRGFGTIEFDRYETGHFFPEIFRLSAKCRYGNCTHTHEPHCAVREALFDHRIAQSRYSSYLSILSDSAEDKYRKPY